MKITRSVAYALLANLAITSSMYGETIIGDEIGNGNFEAEAFGSKAVAYKNVSHWHLIGGNETSTTFGTLQGTNGSPDSAADGRNDRQAAYLFDNDDSSQGDRYAANDTGYTIQSAGESFSIEMALHQFGRTANYHGDEYINAVLFTVAKNLNTSTEVADIEIVASTQLMITGTWLTVSADGFYTTTEQDIGKTVFLGLELVDPQSPEGGRSIFPRFDAVRLEVHPGESTPSAEPE
ncbi:hypothetical protein [Algisphaera agarilytica]|uniref:PEP-CTERM sorting domain-containing protein n=1 Tax=Algisphaera agarilytica TaxID=1385975 RepID=A0A7X0H4W4_9BACT|nr:hypothetical protein [Algisphaera agarilytica]MBB6429148.1 hypothetical protein [Algisphaera agarilytica]